MRTHLDAARFLRVFQEKTVQLHTPEKSQRIWTELMRPVLWSIGQENHFAVRCERLTTFINQRAVEVGYGELEEMDFAYFPLESRQDSDPRFAHVLIEHENSHRYAAAERDFKKLCEFGVPLRVFIGYCNPEPSALRWGERLVKFFDSNNLRQLATGETLLIMGWRQGAPERRAWRVWTLKGKGDWVRHRISDA